jgi:adenylate kinase family enzyme
VERVVVLGCGGAGKSTVANALAARTGLPVVYLDRIFWRPGWKHVPREEARAVLDDAIAEERWILDGNWLSVGDARFERADTAIFLDIPRMTCLARVIRRALRDRRRRRPDLPDGCEEGFDWTFLKWIWNFGRDDRPRIVETLGRFQGNAVHLRSAAEVKHYVESI